MVMDADMLYTKSRLKAVLTNRMCKQDTDCHYFDCHAKCNNETGFCTDRTNSNLEVYFHVSLLFHMSRIRVYI